MKTKTFICENGECKATREVETKTKDGTLVGWGCKKCGWHMTEATQMRNNLLKKLEEDNLSEGMKYNIEREIGDINQFVINKPKEVKNDN